MNRTLALLLSAALVTLQLNGSAADSEEDTTIGNQCPLDKQLCSIHNESNILISCAWQTDTSDIDKVFCNSLYCEPEEFHHDYIARGRKPTPHTNRWKRTRIGERATLHDVCLLRNGLPVTRFCKMEQQRAQWATVQHWPRVQCLGKVREHTVSVQLNNLHDDMLEGRRHTNETRGRWETAALMRSILRQHDRRLLPADVHVTSQMFGALVAQQQEAVLGADLLSVCSTVMASDATVLRLSAELNATNSLLHNFEGYMDSLPPELVPRESCGRVVVSPTSSGSDAASGVETISYAHIGVQALITSNLSVFFVNPACDHITGVAIYGTPAPQLLASSSGFWYRFLRANESMETLRVDPALEAATFLPELLWQAVHGAGATYLVFKVYAHDALFVETTTQRMRRPRSKVLSISIPDFADVLPQPLPFLLRNENYRKPDAAATQSGSGCGYWNYTTWLSDGITSSSAGDMLRDPVIVCFTHHLTQFSFLLGGSYRTNDLGDEVLVTPLHERVLDIISIVGCCLSLFGLLGIWLTAALFKSWRRQASTKLLLHLCLALTLQMVLFVFLNTDDVSEQLITERAYSRCVALGATLHYSILVLFCWMLIIALLQFQRYVTVIGIDRPTHYIFKAALVAWSLPLLPTLLVACINPDSYLPTAAQLATDTGICYPSGYALIFGLVLPVILISIANLVIFVWVLYSISHSLGQSMQRAERKLIAQQLRLSVLLFFLLGLSWIFGIFSFMHAGIVFSYLFCLTATVQGFVLFIYFVLLDEANRSAWLVLICRKKRKLDVEKRMQELQSMTISSTNYSSNSQH